jgi:cytoskeletal protein RodZ
MQEPNLDEYVLEEDFNEAPKTKDGLGARLQKFLESRYFIALIIVLIGIASFFLGRISALEARKVPVKIVSENSNISPNPPYTKGGTGKETPVSGTSQTASSSSPQNTSEGSEKVVASKSGTKYHYPWCAGAKQISPKNLITFNSIEEARAKGYTPASNCKGLK